MKLRIYYAALSRPVYTKTLAYTYLCCGETDMVHYNVESFRNPVDLC